MNQNQTSRTVAACDYLIKKYVKAGLTPEQAIRQAGFASAEDVKFAIWRQNMIARDDRRKAVAG